MVPELEDMKQMNIEWEAWQKVIAALHGLGYTLDDINNGTNDLQTLIDAICMWGEELVELRVHQTEAVRTKAREDSRLKYTNG